MNIDVQYYVIQYIINILQRCSAIHVFRIKNCIYINVYNVKVKYLSVGIQLIDIRHHSDKCNTWKNISQTILKSAQIYLYKI